MFKPGIVGVAALAIAGSSLVYAQQQVGDHEGFGRWRAERHQPLSADDMAAFTDARIAALKAGLELTPDQAKNWPPFEQAARELAQLRIQRIQARQQRLQEGERAQQGENANPFDRLAQRADSLTKTGTALKKLADAGGPLFQSLTDAQKGRFRTLARMLRPHPHRDMFFRHGRGGDHGYGRGGEEFGPEHQMSPNGGDNNDEDHDAEPGNRL